MPLVTDLRDDKQFFVDHPGSVPITAAQVKIPPEFFLKTVNCNDLKYHFLILTSCYIESKGEELMRMIGAPSYIECSSKTQEVTKTELYRGGTSIINVFPASRCL